MVKIDVDSEMGKQLGFTADIFDRESYLWLEDKTMWCSCIIVVEGKRRNGYCIRFIAKLNEQYRVKVPTPSDGMIFLLTRLGFSWKLEWIEEAEENYDVWTHRKLRTPIRFCQHLHCNRIAEWEGEGVAAMFGAPLDGKYCTKCKEAYEEKGENDAIMEYNRFKPVFWKIGTKKPEKGAEKV